MIAAGIARGLKLGMFKHQLNTAGRREIGRFARTSCSDSPEDLVPFLKAIFDGLAVHHLNYKGSEEIPDEVEIPDTEFRDLLALVTHKSRNQIEHLGKGTTGRLALCYRSLFVFFKLAV